MRWLDFPPIAEFEDRHGTVRAVRGCTVLGRFEFVDRLGDLGAIIDTYPLDMPWGEVYQNDSRFRHAIDRALGCWGINVEWLTISQIEQLLFSRDGERGWLIELADPTPSHEGSSEGPGMGLAETIAAIATHCESLSEAMQLSSCVPADLLTDILKAKGKATESPGEIDRREKMAYLRDNFNNLMAKSCGSTS
jgi:hypothetical protein